MKNIIAILCIIILGTSCSNDTKPESEYKKPIIENIIDKDVSNTIYWVGKINNQSVRKNKIITISGKSITISGWAVDLKNQTIPEEVTVIIDKKKFSADIGKPRKDVSKRYKNEDYTNSGWSVTFAKNEITKGRHLVKVEITDKNGYSSPNEEYKIVFVTK